MSEKPLQLPTVRAMTGRGERIAPAPLLIDAAEASRLTGVSKRQWFVWQSIGAIPPACLRRGRIVRWRHADIVRWIAQNCPPASRFEVRP